MTPETWLPIWTVVTADNVPVAVTVMVTSPLATFSVLYSPACLLAPLQESMAAARMIAAVVRLTIGTPWGYDPLPVWDTTFLLVSFKRAECNGGRRPVAGGRVAGLLSCRFVRSSLWLLVSGCHPERSEGPGWTGGAPHTHPGPSLRSGMTLRKSRVGAGFWQPATRQPPTRQPTSPRRNQIREQPVRARHAGRQLPEPGERGVDDRALAVVRVDLAAAASRLAGIVHF